MWNCKREGPYAYTSDEAKENAIEIYNLLYSRGWTLPAICGVLGNINSESGFNPWRWQSDEILNSYDDITTQHGHAYGLVQFDPASKYINNARNYSGYGPNFRNKTGSKFDGRAQMLYVDEHADYYPTQTYNITYAQYKAITLAEHNLEWITHAWFSNYERGTWDSGRVTVAQYMYEYLSGVTPGPSPTPVTAPKIPIWMMIKARRRR